MFDVWVSVCVYGTFFRPGFGTLYLLDNRETWPLTVKPHLTTPFRLCLACAFEQSSMLFVYLEPLGACSQASLRRIKLSTTVSNSYYGMPREQIHINLPPGHPIIAIRNNRNQNGRRIGKKVYCCAKKTKFCSFPPLFVHWKSILLTQPSHLFTDTH